MGASQRLKHHYSSVLCSSSHELIFLGCLKMLPKRILQTATPPGRFLEYFEWMANTRGELKALALSIYKGGLQHPFDS